MLVRPEARMDAVEDVLSRARLLLVEDEAPVLRVVMSYLERRGARVTVAGTTAEALVWLEAGSFDLVIADVGLPGVSGLELLREVRARWPALPFILMTGSLEPYGDSDYAPADARLQKPFELRSLGEAVARVLPRPRAQSG